MITLSITTLIAFKSKRDSLILISKSRSAISLWNYSDVYHIYFHNFNDPELSFLLNNMHIFNQAVWKTNLHLSASRFHWKVRLEKNNFLNNQWLCKFIAEELWILYFFPKKRYDWSNMITSKQISIMITLIIIIIFIYTITYALIYSK